MKGWVIRRLALLPLVAALALSCKHDASQNVRPAIEPPIPPPSSLVAEGTLRDPDAFWGKLRKGGGGLLAPDTAAAAILGWAGVDPSVAPLVAGAAPFHVALGAGPAGLSYAIAMKLGDLDAVRAALVEGETARFRGEDVAGMIRIVPRQGPAPKIAVAISWSGYLVVASSDADLGTLGAYATRTLPTKALPSSSLELRVDPGALGRAGKAAPELAGKATGSLADVARTLLPPEVDANAVAACFTPGLRDAIAAGGDLADARIDADAVDGKLDVVAALVPKAGDNAARKRIAAIHPADASPLLDAPREALAALFWSDTAEARADEAGTLGPCLGKALAPILGPGGGAKLADVMAAWARGRGDWETASFVARPSVAGLVARAPVKDAAAVASSTRGFADLAAQPSLADAIHRLLPLRAGQAPGPAPAPAAAAAPAAIQLVDVPRVGKASVLVFPSHAPPAHGDEATPMPALAPPGLAWIADAKEADVAVGQSPAELLAFARPLTALRASTAVDHAVTALGSDASFAAVFVPPGCCTGSTAASAPLTLAWGKKGDSGRGTLSIGDVLLGQLVAHAAGP